MAAAGGKLKVAKGSVKNKLLKVLMYPPSRLKKGHGPAATSAGRLFHVTALGGADLIDATTATNYAPNTVGDICLQKMTTANQWVLWVCTAFTSSASYNWNYLSDGVVTLALA